MDFIALCFARNNHESHHNSWYWRGGDFIGLGPGSHSRFHEKNERGLLCRVASVQAPSPREWLTSVQASGHGVRKVVYQNHYDIATELLCSAFRTSWGLESDNWRTLYPEIALKDLGSVALLSHFAKCKN